MEIKDAIIVDIDFDNDIYFNEGTYVFTEHDEVIELIRNALFTMNNKRYAYSDELINDDEWIYYFIYYGGGHFGNWEITISFTSYKAQEMFALDNPKMSFDEFEQTY